MRSWLLVLLLSVAACSSDATPDAPPVANPVVTSGTVPDTASDTVPATLVDTVPEGSDAVTGTVPPVTPPSSAAPSVPDGVVVPEGFASVAATITADDGEVCDVCLWLADTTDLRARGLMFVTDLGGREGMAFVYPSPHSGTFWMKNTVTPLSIAFFAPDGAYLDAFDMQPCTTEPCLQYATPSDFTVAVEVVQGDLGELGVGPGSRLDLSDLPCDLGA